MYARVQYPNHIASVDVHMDGNVQSLNVWKPSFKMLPYGMHKILRQFVVVMLRAC